MARRLSYVDFKIALRLLTVVLVPASATSMRAFIADAGNVQIRNVFSSPEAGNQQKLW